MNPNLIELENAYILKNILPKAFNKREIKYNVSSAKLYKWIKNRFVYDKAIISSDRFDNGETEFQVYVQTENLGVWEYTKYIDKNGDTRRGNIFISPTLYFYVVCGDKLYAYNMSKLNKRNYGRGFKLSIDEAYRVFNIKNIRKEFNEKYNYINDLPIHLGNRKICELIEHFNFWSR